LLETVQKREGSRRWVTVTEIAEGLSKTLRVKVGEPIATSNQTKNDTEEACIEAIQGHVAGVLKDYVDFLHVKIHRNVTMTAYVSSSCLLGTAAGGGWRFGTWICGVLTARKAT
jgi:hypothetical protein